MTEETILDRIRQNRNRAVVPSRNDSLVAASPASQTEQINPPEVLEDVTTPQTTASDGSTLAQLRAELDKVPKTRRHSAIVLDEKIDAQLTRFCKDQGVTVELFLEAAWLMAQADPGLQQAIIVEAKRRYIGRKRAGKLRRMITMLSELSEHYPNQP